ncbi:hypothetical protein AB6A40_008143 [Gnathostoma spinigerum]|uniref:Uncharacterized protein n=1 Tax=Gnathostoma spinigerum TaxID=75299 RepID=A0ABD6EN76_9BILA
MVEKCRNLSRFRREVETAWGSSSQYRTEMLRVESAAFKQLADDTWKELRILRTERLPYLEGRTRKERSIGRIVICGNVIM